VVFMFLPELADPQDRQIALDLTDIVLCSYEQAWSTIDGWML